MPRIVVLGGGYAGLATLIALSKQDKSLELHLVDAHLEHCKITNLHKTFRHPVENFTVRYAQLAERFNFTFHHQPLAFSLQEISHWQKQKKLPLPQAGLSFDWLVVSTGASPVSLPGGQSVPGQTALRRGEGRALFAGLAENRAEEVVDISLVGGGATGVQVLFELHEQLRKKRIPNRIRLIGLTRRLVPTLPQRAHTYIEKKMRRAGIEYLPETKYLGQAEKQIHLEELTTGRQYALRTSLSLLFPGVTASPLRLETNPYGQVIIAGQVLSNVFSAGDCSHYNSSGLNLLTAQAAVRKGKLVARNISNLCRGKSLQKYRYQEKGYLVSLGAIDAIGWLGLRCNLVKGFPASVIKEAMESQYDLFLDGVDTYVDFP